MKKILLYIWQLPQNVLALILAGVYSLIWGRFIKVNIGDICYLYFKKWRCGVSLGHYVLLGDYALERPDIIKHEYGHTRQSIFLGPLYLILIGLPSATWNLIDRILMRTVKGWAGKKSDKIYYNMPWEHWADMLGGVERHYE